MYSIKLGGRGLLLAADIFASLKNMQPGKRKVQQVETEKGG